MGEEYYYSYKRNHVPAFGSWDWNDNLPFTQCFESARQGGLIRHIFSESEDRDLYVTGDFYEKKDAVTSTMIIVPPRMAMDSEPPSQTTLLKPTPKPVDEDLYMISPEIVFAKVKKKRVLCFFSSCSLPTCIA